MQDASHKLLWSKWSKDLPFFRWDPEYTLDFFYWVLTSFLGHIRCLGSPKAKPLIGINQALCWGLHGSKQINLIHFMLALSYFELKSNFVFLLASKLNHPWIVTSSFSSSKKIVTRLMLRFYDLATVFSNEIVSFQNLIIILKYNSNEK